MTSGVGILSSDSSLQACGGFWDGKYFHSKFPAKVTDRGYSINILEMLAIIVCLKLWGKFLCREKDSDFL